MDPISNKKDFENLTFKLRDLAYTYIEKYSPTKQQIKTYLIKKYLIKFKGNKQKREVVEIINKIVENLEKNNLINDKLYSDSKARVLFKRGYSLNKISNSLKSKGIDYKNINESLEKIKSSGEDPDFISAMRICKKKRIGPMRPDANREIFYKKDLGILARSGFSYDISKKILDMSQKEFLQILKLT